LIVHDNSLHFPAIKEHLALQTGIITQNSNVNSVIAQSSVINNMNLVNNVVQTTDEQVSSPIRAC